MESPIIANDFKTENVSKAVLCWSSNCEIGLMLKKKMFDICIAKKMISASLLGARRIGKSLSFLQADNEAFDFRPV